MVSETLSEGSRRVRFSESTFAAAKTQGTRGFFSLHIDFIIYLVTKACPGSRKTSSRETSREKPFLFLSS